MYRKRKERFMTWSERMLAPTPLEVVITTLAVVGLIGSMIGLLF